MKPKKEHYRRKLPHFQQPGQWYFVTCLLVSAIPKGALNKYSLNLEAAKKLYLSLKKEAERDMDLPKSVNMNVDFPEPVKINVDFPKSVKENFDFGKSKSRIEKAKKDYRIALRKYSIAYDKILNNSSLPRILLNKKDNLKIMEEALSFYEGKRVTSHAWCIMPNHFHWVLTVNKADENSMPVYLQDILHSVKLYTARRINRNENRSGQFWEHESFETTLRDDKHFINAVNYTIMNPVVAGLVNNWEDWPGTRTFLSP
ncbi:MAG: transposase [Prolixibacteraceae bacterium]|nr:transposase [Prolixibacteraceae bacterium]MBN2774989.1 transposase [Prolixibacteraceae bacterium]